MQHRFVRGESVTVPPTAEGWVPSPVAHHQAQGQSRRPLGCPRPRGAVGAQLLESGARGKRGGAGSDCFRAAPAAPPPGELRGGPAQPRRGHEVPEPRAGAGQELCNGTAPTRAAQGSTGCRQMEGEGGLKKKKGKKREKEGKKSCWLRAGGGRLIALFVRISPCVISALGFAGK